MNIIDIIIIHENCVSGKIRPSKYYLLKYRRRRPYIRVPREGAVPDTEYNIQNLYSGHPLKSTIYISQIRPILLFDTSFCRFTYRRQPLNFPQGRPKAPTSNILRRIYRRGLFLLQTGSNKKFRKRPVNTTIKIYRQNALTTVATI